MIVKAYNKTDDAYVVLNADLSKNDLTFYKNNDGSWTNFLTQQNHVAKIKAFTTTQDFAGSHDNDLQFSTVELNKNIVRYDEVKTIELTSVRLVDTLLIKGVDYELENRMKLNKPTGGTSSDDEIIGEGTIIIRGIGKYHGEKEVNYTIIVALYPKVFPENIDFDPNTKKCVLNVKGNETKYNQIQLPQNWKWAFLENLITFDKDQDNYLNYIGDDEWCYRRSTFDITAKHA